MESTTKQAKKTYNVKVKPRHREVALKMAEPGRTLGSALAEVGYSKAVQESPTKVTDTRSFRQIAEELGLTKSFVLNALREDIEKKPQFRGQEIALAMKMHGMLDKTDEVEERDFNISWIDESEASEPAIEAEYTKKDT
jgi:hypothetical protein